LLARPGRDSRCAATSIRLQSSGPKSNGKFSLADVQEREHWDKYLDAYEDAFHATTAQSPWYVVPADHKWFCRLAVSSIICSHMKSLHLQYPPIDEAKQEELAQARLFLEREANHK
jgi:hypothetical protein